MRCKYGKILKTNNNNNANGTKLLFPAYKNVRIEIIFDVYKCDKVMITNNYNNNDTKLHFTVYKNISISITFKACNESYC